MTVRWDQLNHCSYKKTVILVALSMLGSVSCLYCHLLTFFLINIVKKYTMYFRSTMISLPSALLFISIYIATPITFVGFV